LLWSISFEGLIIMAVPNSSTAEAHTNGVNGTNDHPSVDYEAVVVGAGFGGIRMLYELGKRGISARVFEAGSNVGGTWYWNRYPGARTDSESWVYILTFLEEIGMDWSWKERFPTQPEVEQYLNRITDHFDLRKNIQFNTRITAAHRDDAKNVWRVTTSKGEELTCTFLVTATGPLATPLKPPFPGLDSYKGEWYQTGLWPKHKVDFAGKRVGVVGTGATAVQVIPVVAHTAKTLTIFQRTPNYVLPSRNHPLMEDQMMEIKQDYGKVFNRARAQAFGMDFVDATRTSTDMKNDAEFQRVLDFGWEKGGFRFIFETFADMLTNAECNEAAGEFIRNKIRSIVKDEKTAELLCPNYTILSKRPPLGHFYYETFNRENVLLIDIKNDPILEITPTGLRTGTAEYEFDIIIFAVGFDAITGTLAQIDLRGSDNQLLAEQLHKKMATAYGITVSGFPNLFMVSGPQAPFANIPVIIDNTVDWIGKTMAHMREHGHQRMDTKTEVAEKWSELVNMVFNATVLPQGAKDTRSWYIGANVEGKTVEPMFFFGGVAPYFAHCEKEITDGFPGFTFSSPIEAA
jgi:cation diffusion facilitator CzcD-associated flavoprotein CzcO